MHYYTESKTSFVEIKMSKKEGIYDTISTLLKFSKLLGFTLHNFSNFDISNTSQLKVPFLHILGTVLGCTLMATAYILGLNEFHAQSTSRKLLSLICGLRILGCCGILISNLHNQKYLILATWKLNNVDREMSKMRKAPSYGIASLLLFLGCSSIFIGTISLRIAYIIIGQDGYLYVLINFWTQGYEFLILCTNTVYLVFFLFVIRTRFITLMALINRNRKKLRCGEERSQLEIFLKISQMYNDLCSCAANINKFTSWSSFISVMCNFLEGMIVANMIYKQESSYQDVLLVATYLLLTLSTLLLPMFVEEMQEKIAILLVGIEVLNCHQEIKKAKNIFLYQALHSKVEFSICGLFLMSMSSLPEQFSFCISLVLFMYQIAG